MPRTMFSATVNVSTRRKCWYTIPMPRRGGVVRRPQVDRLAVDRDLATVGPVQPGEHGAQRRLAGSVLAEQPVDLAADDVEVDGIDRRNVVERLGEAADLERREGSPGRHHVSRGSPR